MGHVARGLHGQLGMNRRSLPVTRVAFEFGHDGDPDLWIFEAGCA